MTTFRRLSNVKLPKVPTPTGPAVTIHTLHKPVAPSGTTLTGARPLAPPDSRGFKFMVFPPPPGNQKAVVREIGPGGQEGPPATLHVGGPPHAFAVTDVRTTAGTETAPGGLMHMDGQDGEAIGTTIGGLKRREDKLSVMGDDGQTRYSTVVSSNVGSMRTRNDGVGKQWLERMKAGTADGYVFDLGPLSTKANAEALKFADDWATAHPEYSFLKGDHCILLARDLAVHLLAKGHLGTTNPDGAQALASADVGHIFSTRLVRLFEQAGLTDTSGRPIQMTVVGSPRPEPGTPRFIADVHQPAAVATINAELAKAAPGAMVSFQLWTQGPGDFYAFGTNANLFDADFHPVNPRASIESVTFAFSDGNNKIQNVGTYTEFLPLHEDLKTLEPPPGSRAFITVNVRKAPEQPPT